MATRENSRQEDTQDKNSQSTSSEARAGDGRASNPFLATLATDTFAGSEGADWVSYASSTRGVYVVLDADPASNLAIVDRGWAAYDRLTGVNNLIGSAYNDDLIGNNAANILRGGAGRDYLVGGAGADILDGGQGDADAALYHLSDKGVRVDLSRTEAQQDFDGTHGLAGNGNEAVGDILIGIEDLWGSTHADWLTGDNGDNRIHGNDGDDHLYGGDGNDHLYGGAGSDYLYGSWGDDRLEGGAGSDYLYGSWGDDRLEGGAGDDTLDGSWGDDRLEGGAGDDTLDGRWGDDRLEGGAGDDTLYGSWGDDRLEGGAGDDTLYGSWGDDRLEGGAGDDTLDGSWGDDRLEGGAGNDVLIGDTGTDTVSYSNSFGGVRVDLSRTGAQLGFYSNDASDAVGDILTSIENIEGSDYADWLTGDSNHNTFYGGDGDDRLEGGAGEDTYVFNAGDGTDTVADDAGLNQLVFAALTGDHVDSVQRLSFTDVGSNLEISINSDGDGAFDGTDDSKVILEGVFNEGTGHILGAHNVIKPFNLYRGSSDPDNLIGRMHVGGAGGDLRVDLGAGNDIFYGGAGNDYQIYLGAGDDIFYSGAGNDYRIYLEAGDDIFYGGAGSDYQIYTGTGDDTFYGGTGSDYKIYTGAGDDTFYGGAGNDYKIYTGAGDDTLYGDAGNDGLSGDEGNDILYGGTGNDTLIGGAGNDRLEGGAGDDLYVFQVRDGTDTIVDEAGDTMTLLFQSSVYEAADFVEASDNFNRVGNNLEITIDKDLNDDIVDKITIENAYDSDPNTGTGNAAFTINIEYGGDTLTEVTDVFWHTL